MTENEYNIFFYGFFVIKPVESLAVHSYENMLDKLTQWLRSVDIEKMEADDKEIIEKNDETKINET